MEIVTKKRKYTVKGGKTILGSLFSYQERTGMALSGILRLPYIYFVLGMIDAPYIEYDELEKEEVHTPKTVEEEISSLTNFLK